ncbi:hypothetical protein [Scytonema sp. PRP1]|uniref:hypothetical protein n=1 Tax=Scytonema sp. PRP1 TaxID=3120513 RepID=UPI002FCF7D12
MPQALDFAPHFQFKYLGCFIDYSRKKEDFKVERLSGTKPFWLNNRAEVRSKG